MTITDIITNLNFPIPDQNSNFVKAFINNNTPPAFNNNISAVVINNALNPLLDNRTKRLIIKEAEKIDIKLMLMISKNIDKKNLKKTSRLTFSLSYYGKAQGENTVTTMMIMEYWLKRHRSLS